MLDELRVTHGRLDEPVPVGDQGGTIRVELNHTDADSLPVRLPARRQRHPDPRGGVEPRAGGRPGHPGQQGPPAADQGVRGRPRRRGVPRRDRSATPTPATPAWPSWRSTPRTSTSSTTTAPLDLEAARELPCHSGLVLLSERGTALGRVGPDKQVRLVRGDREAFGIHGRSAEQRIALEMLLDPEVGIVSLGGRAGTGKSALALVRRARGRPGARPAQEGRGLPAAVRGRRAGARLPARLGVGEDGALGAGGLRHPWGDHLPRGDRGGPRPRHARGAAADPHPGPLPARRVRHRRRGAVAGAQRAAHRALPDRARAPRWC